MGPNLVPLTSALPWQQYQMPANAVAGQSSLLVWTEKAVAPDATQSVAHVSIQFSAGPPLIGDVNQAFPFLDRVCPGEFRLRSLFAGGFYMAECVPWIQAQPNIGFSLPFADGAATFQRMRSYVGGALPADTEFPRMARYVRATHATVNAIWILQFADATEVGRSDGTLSVPIAPTCTSMQVIRQSNPADAVPDGTLLWSTPFGGTL